MELLAPIKAIQNLKKNQKFQFIQTDLCEGWDNNLDKNAKKWMETASKKPVKNMELWKN